MAVGDASDHVFPIIRTPGPRFTWAGGNPWNGGLCFGFEDGSIWFTELDRTFNRPEPWADSGEGINGVAFTKDAIAISTRAEVVFNRFDDQNPYERQVFAYRGGAHGVISTEGGSFIAPLGHEGLLYLNPGLGSDPNWREVRAIRAEFDYYKIAQAARSDAGEEILACACREGGLLALPLSAGGTPSQVRSRSPVKGPDFERDIVDVCSIATPRYPRAVASLNIDNNLFLTKDILESSKVTTLKLPAASGSGYSVLSVDGHVILQTSEAIYAFPHLAKHFLGDTLASLSRLKATVLRIESIDCSIAHGEYLLIVEPRVVTRAPLQVLVESLRDLDGAELGGDWSEPSANYIDMTPDFDESDWVTSAPATFQEVF